MAQTSEQPIAATYSRVSNPNDPRDASLDTQEVAQVALWEKLGYCVPPEYRLRERYTGMESIYDRPVLNQLRDLVATGRINGMSTYDTDRLARDPNELLTVVRDNHKQGVETRFVQCDYATEGRIGEMILYMKGFASALEYDAIRDRTMRVKRKILTLGQWVGDGKPKYGLAFLKDEQGRRRVAEPDEAPIVRRIFELVCAGHSTTAIARLLTAEGIATPSAHAGSARPARQWWASVVTALVRDPIYVGQSYAHKTMRGEGRLGCGKPRRKMRPKSEWVLLDEAATEPLLTRELFERANRILDGRRSVSGRTSLKLEYQLRGRIFCGVCGHRLTPTTHNYRDHRSKKPATSRQYRCVAHRRRPDLECRSICGAGWVEETGWTVLRDYLIQPGRLERLLDEEIAKLETEDGVGRMESDLSRAEARRRKVAEMMSRAIDAKLATDDHIKIKLYDEKLESLSREAADLDKHTAGLRHQISMRGERRRMMASTLEHVETIRARLLRGEPDDAEKRRIVEMLDARFYAWSDPHDGRRIRVELPIGLHGANLAGCSTASGEFYTVRLESR